MIAFGPVPSRRLGRSLGINNIPPKTCSYSCVYCQVGNTSNLKIRRNEYYEPGDIFGDVQDLLVKLKKRKEKIDFFTFVSDGEPTLDINLGHEIDLLKLLDHKIAIITNASLITHRDVQDSLMKADYVSIKIDATDTRVWKRINRPNKNLNLDDILESIVCFSKIYKGHLITETMLVEDINCSFSHMESVAGFISKLEPFKAYVAIPTRPTAKKDIKLPEESTVNEVFQIFKTKMEQVEYLIGYEGNDFGYSGDVAKDILRITAVHPMRLDSVAELLDKAQSNWQVIENLVGQEKLKEVQYAGNTFFMRSLANSINMGGRR